MNRFLFLLILSCSVLLPSCKDTDKEDLAISREEVLSTSSKNEQFAQALSRALSENEGLRSLIKKRALQRFDKNTDVLYHQMKNLQTDAGESVRSIILKYWEGSPKSFTDFENASPLLNMHLPDLALFKKASAEQWEESAKEVGVALVTPQADDTPLYVDGHLVEHIGKGRIPSIPTIVVNTNKRVRVASSLRSLNGQRDFSYEFLDPSFDGRTNKSKARASHIEEEPAWGGYLDIESFLDPVFGAAWFRIKKQGNIPERAFIYYPNDSILDTGIEEMFYRFKIEPHAYRLIADEPSDTSLKGDDPVIKEDATLVKYGEDQNIAIEEIISKCWTSGVFTFCFDVYTPLRSGGMQTKTIILSVEPQQLFAMNAVTEHSKEFWSFRTKYTYYIRPNLLKARWVYPSAFVEGEIVRISGAWDLREQGLTKKIVVREYDRSASNTVTQSFSSEFVTGISGSSGFKILDIFSLSFGASETRKESRAVSYTVSYTNDSDDLGSAILSFYDPVIDHYSGNDFYPKNITTGSVTMTIFPVSPRGYH